jgi:hypothetical protein
MVIKRVIEVYAQWPIILVHVCVVYRVINSLANLTIFGTVPSSILGLAGSCCGGGGILFWETVMSINGEVFLRRLCVYVSAGGSWWCGDDVGVRV